MAVFVPDPEQFDIEEFIEQLGIDLGQRYRDAEDELIRELATRAYRDLELQNLLPDTPVGRGLTAAERREQNRILGRLAVHRAQAIKELQFIAAAIAEKLSTTEMAEELVRVAAEQGEAAAAARLNLAGRLPTVFQPGAAGQAVAALALSLQSRLEVLNQRITRYPQDAYQRIVSLTAPQTLLGVTTSLRQQQATVRRFLNEGIDAFVDKSGRAWRIGSYAEMAGRTAVNRAFNDASVWTMQQSGINLVTIVGGFDSCKLCAPWIGKILSTDGSPAGVRIMQHATQDQTVAVHVAGTIDQARRAGWNHPNCRCRPVAYFPGLSIPQQDFDYNEQADKERQEQRALERKIRAAKRDIATAPDDVSRRQAERDLRDAQANMRGFTSRTGRARQSYREQLHFADGGTINPRAAWNSGGPSPRTPSRESTNRALQSSMKAHEQEFFRRMESRGEVIDWIAKDTLTYKPTNDFTWVNRGNLQVELKSPARSPKYSSIQDSIKRAVRGAQAQGVVKENFIIDLGDRRLDERLSRALEGYNRGSYPISRLWVLSDGGANLLEIILRSSK